MSDLENKKKHRKVVRCSFTKTANELAQLLQNDPFVRRDTEIVWECLKPKFEELRVCDNQIYSGLLDSDSTEDQLLAEMEGCDIYVRRFTEVRLKTEEKLGWKPEEEEDSSSNSSQRTRRTVDPPSSGKRKFLLPQIQFKQFDGNIRDWLAFWSQFQKIHNDTEIEYCDKIEYLLQATVPGSRARQIVESFPVLGQNYPEIIECLKARFGREDLQIEVYVRELLKLVLHNAASQQQLQLSKLYDNIETQLRALNTLGIASDKYAALLYPLIESCLPQELLRVWQRSSFCNIDNLGSSSSPVADTVEIKLKNIMLFLRSEVENEERIDLASEGFGLVSNLEQLKIRHGKDKGKCSTGAGPSKFETRNLNMTAAGLINTDIAKCIFCSGLHDNAACFKAQNMTLEERKKILTKNNACFKCLKVGHTSRKCRIHLKCGLCGNSHLLLMCQNLSDKNRIPKTTNPESNVQRDQTLSNHTNMHVFLQILRIKVRGTNGYREVRALLDTGSQRSYILKSTAMSLGLKPKRVEKIAHCLFGGTEAEYTHSCYDMTIFHNNYSKTFEVLDQDFICNDITPVFYGPWMHELESFGVQVSDYNGHGKIEVLLGADIIGLLYTGKRLVLKCGLVANETYVGWTIEGKVPTGRSHSMTVTSLFVNSSITDLWQLDILGIQEPTERRTREEMALAAKEAFLETVIVNDEGRYEVKLPWLENHSVLPTNYSIAQKRLEACRKKLQANDLLAVYDEVFREWQSLNIIQRTDDRIEGHFLPHRPVLKEGSTTAVRPVFDASAREKDRPSLNQCLEKGLNLIERIPSLLIGFREQKIGIISDIKKAFLQINVSTEDRKFLKFLWINEKGEQITFVHNRVVFGVNCSPFLLGATIDFHLSQCLKNCSVAGSQYSRATIEKLAKSFYVDNCVTSVPNYDYRDKFIRESVNAMAEAKFELRGWEFSGNSSAKEEYKVCVLGLVWYPSKDILTINRDSCTVNTNNMTITKRKILSITQKVFDPIGFTSPATLSPKLWLQELWKAKISWDAEVDEEISKRFRSWTASLPNLLEIEIPRWTKMQGEAIEDVTIHTFVDASKVAYAAVVYSRVVQAGKTSVHLLAAKSRVAPIRKLTIPRLELLAATIGARLFAQTIEKMTENYNSYFWSDSTTVISWIQRSEDWGTFVHNRVVEIRTLTSEDRWRHVPGSCNPADLASRGCSPKQLLESKWWKGPEWLYCDVEHWPHENFSVNEEEVLKEKKQRSVKTLINTEKKDFWHFNYFSKFSKSVRMMAWIYRFSFNSRNSNVKKGDLTVEELDNAEQFIIKCIQNENFADVDDPRIKCLDPFYDELGVLRLKSRVCNREDTKDFRFPIILPSKNNIVDTLIMDFHRNSCHAGVQTLLSMLREKYWILGGRRTIRSVLNKCVICRRHASKPVSVISPPLPADRVCDSVPFQITGVDFAGPLFLKGGGKAWVCLFTCAVYRAVHLELTMSLSTSNFLQVFRRFVARRGRPKTMYSDNGTNFRGTDNAFGNLDWQKITRETSTQRIVWRFDPPSAPWWGGFFERLVGVVKQLLRKVLGKACLGYEELSTLICECEAMVNARPLTYVSNDPKDLAPLTASMFLREQHSTDLPDCDEIDKTSLSQSIRHKQKLRTDLRRRFRSEYLGQLKLFLEQKQSNSLKLGQIVLVGNDYQKRVEWPLARVVEIIPGKDGHTRLVRVQTERGELLRPVRRLYPLECDGDSQSTDGRLQRCVGSGEVANADAVIDDKEDLQVQEENVSAGLGAGSARKKIESEAENGMKGVTRCGRVIKLPDRYL